MTLLQGIIIGILQGLTGAWPLSADGHLLVANYFFGFETNLGLGFILQAAMILAVLICYAKEIWWGIRHPKWRYCGYYLIAALPILIVRCLQFLFFPSDGRLIWIVPVLFVANGVFLIVAGNYQKRRGNGSLSLTGAAFIGLVQLISFLPGLSSLTVVLFAALFWGLGREEAVRFSFLVTLPVNFILLILQVLNMFRNTGAVTLPLPELYGGIAALAAATWGVYSFKKSGLRNLGFFALYCFGGALVLFVLLILGL